MRVEITWKGKDIKNIKIRTKYYEYKKIQEQMYTQVKNVNV